MRRLFLFLFVLLLPSIVNATIVIYLKNGSITKWSNYTENGDQYCTQKSYGSFCIPRSTVATIKEEHLEDSDGTTVIYMQKPTTILHNDTAGKVTINNDVEKVEIKSDNIEKIIVKANDSDSTSNNQNNLIPQQDSLLRAKSPGEAQRKLMELLQPPIKTESQEQKIIVIDTEKEEERRKKEDEKSGVHFDPLTGSNMLYMGGEKKNLDTGRICPVSLPNCK